MSGGSSEKENKRIAVDTIFPTRVVVISVLLVHFLLPTMSKAFPIKCSPKQSKYFTNKRKVSSPISSTRASSFSPSPTCTSRLHLSNTDHSKEKSSSPRSRTSSFQALTFDSWLSNENPSSELSINPDPPPPHTLILGTHPSKTSLQRHEYFGHDLNAFWWIAGDCLGFRRKEGKTAKGDAYYQLVEHLRYSPEEILSYPEQIRVFLSHGFCLWDIVQSCERASSLDQDIEKEQPNRVQEFVQDNPSIQRIVLANGSTSAKFFQKHFKNWLLSDEIVLNDDYNTQKVWSSLQKKKRTQSRSAGGHRQITVVVALGVSPAAAKFSYLEKRDFWEKNVYKPGLLIHEATK